MIVAWARPFNPLIVNLKSFFFNFDQHTSLLTTRTHHVVF